MIKYFRSWFFTNKKPIKGVKLSISNIGARQLKKEMENRKGGVKSLVKDYQEMMDEFIKNVLDGECLGKDFPNDSKDFKLVVPYKRGKDK